MELPFIYCFTICFCLCCMCVEVYIFIYKKWLRIKGKRELFLAMIHFFAIFTFLASSVTGDAPQAFPWYPLFLGAIYSCTPSFPPTASLILSLLGTSMVSYAYPSPYPRGVQRAGLRRNDTGGQMSSTVAHRVAQRPLLKTWGWLFEISSSSFKDYIGMFDRLSESMSLFLRIRHRAHSVGLKTHQNSEPRLCPTAVIHICHYT